MHSNVTFSNIAESLDILAVSKLALEKLSGRNFGEGPSMLKSWSDIKITADFFETMIAAYYLETDYNHLYDWVKKIWIPLIHTAAQAFEKFMAS